VAGLDDLLRNSEVVPHEDVDVRRVVLCEFHGSLLYLQTLLNSMLLFWPGKDPVPAAVPEGWPVLGLSGAAAKARASGPIASHLWTNFCHVWLSPRFEVMELGPISAPAFQRNSNPELRLCDSQQSIESCPILSPDLLGTGIALIPARAQSLEFLAMFGGIAS
jgi:hypothetical protein